MQEYRPIVDKDRYVLKTCGMCKASGKKVRPLGKHWSRHWITNHPGVPKQGTVLIENSDGVQS